MGFIEGLSNVAKGAAIGVATVTALPLAAIGMGGVGVATALGTAVAGIGSHGRRDEQDGEGGRVPRYRNNARGVLDFGD